jgi:hypothetical protein
MVSRLSFTVTLWRWVGAAGMLITGGWALRMGHNRLEDLLPLLMGAGLVGLEIYMRMARKTLRVQSGQGEVFERGVPLGTFYVRDVRHASWLSRLRSLIKSMLLPILPFAIGGVNMATGSTGPGALLILLGAASVAASVWDFKRLWLITVPKPRGGEWTLLLDKADTIGLLGFWPAKVDNGQR